jgi:hypothetical protein
MQRLRTARLSDRIHPTPAQPDLNDLRAMTRLLLALLLALLACAGHAQEEDLYITGYVHDVLTDQPLSGCKVELRQDKNAVVMPVPVSERGEFLFDLETKAEGIARYTVHFSMEGYTPVELRIDATDLPELDEEDDGWVLKYAVLMARGTGTAERSKSTFNSGVDNFTFSGIPANIWSGYVEDVLFDLHYDTLARIDSLPNVNVFGYVREQRTRAKIMGAEVSIRRDEEQAPSALLRTDAFGFYACALQYDTVYHITFSYADRVSKTVTLDLRNIPVADREGGFGSNLDVNLFPPIPGEDLSFLDQPMGRMRYSPALLNLEWDMAITAPIQQRLNAILDRSQSR